MTYEINVTHHGRHLFATHPRSLTTMHETVTLYREFRRVFPSADGYSLMVTRAPGTREDLTEQFAQTEWVAR